MKAKVHRRHRLAADRKQLVLTRSVEDYLKVIYSISGQGGFATTREIADRLKLSAPSVSGMLKRLSELLLIEHLPYRGVELTTGGRRVALKMVRRHRVLELYLTRHLGFHWDDVHEEAERLEHAVSDDLIERMAVALGNPRYDPHGDPIPTSAGEIDESKLPSLADAAVGAVLELRQVRTQDPARLRFFAEQGLVPGVRLTVTDRQPFNGPTTVHLDPTGGARVVGMEAARLLLCRRAAA